MTLDRGVCVSSREPCAMDTGTLILPHASFTAFTDTLLPSVRIIVTKLAKCFICIVAKN